MPSQISTVEKAAYRWDSIRPGIGRHVVRKQVVRKTGADLTAEKIHLVFRSAIGHGRQIGARIGWSAAGRLFLVRIRGRIICPGTFMAVAALQHVRIVNAVESGAFGSHRRPGFSEMFFLHPVFPKKSNHQVPKAFWA